MRVYQKIILILAFVILVSHNSQAITCDSVSLALMEQTWREFRTIHPFGFQTVGLKHYGDTCVFVISEPAEWVKAEELEDLFSEYDGHLIIGRKSFGYDGGLYDAIGCAKLDSTDLADLGKKLFILLYGTDYKQYYTDLNYPSPHVYYTERQVSFSLDKRFWLSNEWWWEEMFEDHNSELEFRKLMDLFDRFYSPNDLFYSKKRGVVVWVIHPENVNPADRLFLKNARRFALDTDLILAAFCKKNIFVVGREREIPVNIMPPLRSETLCLLASLDASDFSVNICPNYENVIEDSMWARPIVMNDKIRDTELGNLLTLTDILFLSLSNNSTIRDSFIDYPLPPQQKAKYEIDPQSGNTLQYLWRLPHIYYNVKIPRVDELGRIRYIGTLQDSCDFVMLNDTGSLQPYYLTKGGNSTQDTNNIEKKAYDFFSSLNNIDLIRTAQYALIYQAFQLYKRNSEVNLQFSINNAQESWVQTPSMAVLNVPWGDIDYQK